LAVRLVQTIGFDDDGDAIRALICLSPVRAKQPRRKQLLEGHVTAVECEAQRLVAALKLEEPFRSALLFAAQWHDEGKKADRWQRYIGGPDQKGRPLGKSAEWRDPKLLAGYRHEFGSLLRIPKDEFRRYCTDLERNIAPERQDDAYDLALHLIAAHHGYARPHFVDPWDEDFNTLNVEQTHIEAIRRYARLQRKYGWWGLAYLESLLRVADGAASDAAGLDPETDDDDIVGSDGGSA
jgi:CRISPR-associated endonuclease/helicase Cas3